MKIVITGTSSGIGRQAAESLFRAGHEIWGWARSDQSSWAKSLDPAGERVRTTCVDVSRWHEAAAAAKHVAHVWSEVHALVCCAGAQGQTGRAMECDPQAWANTVSSNVGGTFFPIRAIFPYLKGSQHQRAKVLVFSGGGSTKARPFFSAYGAAKTAIVRLAETLAEEWRQMPIDINAVAPGAIYTPMIEEIIQHGARIVGEAEYAAALKLKAQRDSASRVIDLVFFLLSADSDRLSGKLISAAWDPWIEFAGKGQSLSSTELYTLRRLIQ